MHRFAIDDSIKRLIHTTEIPTVFNANVAWLSKGGINYIPVKLGNRVVFFSYDPENNKIQEVSFNHESEH